MFPRLIHNQFLIVDEYVIKNDDKLNEKNYNRYLPIKVLENDKTLIMPLITKCANTTIANLYVNLNITETNLRRNDNKNFWSLYYIHDKYVNINNYENKLCVAVIRDPLERIKSAYRTCCNFNHFIYDVDFYYDMVCASLEKYKEGKFDNIDRHINSQFTQYDIENIDLFVHINDLDRFFAKHDITTEPLNVSREKIKFNNEDKLLELLKEDYHIYNNIINSDKMFR